MRGFLLLFALAIVVSPASGQFTPDLPGTKTKARKFADVADLKAEIVPAQAKPGEAVTLKLTIAPKAECWTYPFFPPAGQSSKNGITPSAENPLVFVGRLTEPNGWIEKDSDEPGRKDRVYKKAVTWEFPLIVSPEAKPFKGSLAIQGFSLQACNSENCFPTRTVNAEFEVLEGLAPVSAQVAMHVHVDFVIAHLSGKPKPILAATSGGENPPSRTTPEDPKTKPGEAKSETGPAGAQKKAAKPIAEYQAELTALENLIGKQKVTREGGVLTLLITAAFWGLISLATPCVFPMIPITVSLFLKQSNQTTGGAAKLAAIYCGTIILVLGLAAIFLLSVFRELSINPWMNVFLGLLFVVFALSLFGMYDITLPNFLLRYSEGKRKQGGLMGTVFGAIAFSIVSFTCVAPFLGGFAGMAASGQYSRFELILAGLAFASAFALPFFILALFPSMLKKLPKSGGWLDSVKAVMGFLEIAAALKFLRTAELRWSDQPAYFTYDLVLAGWVAIFAACGAYLLNLFRLPHDEEKPNIGVPRLVFAMMFLGLSVYLLPGIFKVGHAKEGQRPSGVVYEWIDAFLLPEPSNAAGGSGSSEELPWSADLPGTVAAAREQAKKANASKFIFADFTGVTCTNCKWNERNVFTQDTVKDLLKNYALVQMYTDDVPANFYTTPPALSARTQEGSANLAFQQRLFGTEQLPLYAILEAKPDGTVGIFEVYSEGKINAVGQFVEFLRKQQVK
jgi:thiol:disulfide interchange protein DsbD